MPTYTTNYHLTKPAVSDAISPLDFDSNFDIIDSQLAALSAMSGNLTDALSVLSTLQSTISELSTTVSGQSEAISAINATLGDISAILDEINGEVI